MESERSASPGSTLTSSPGTPDWSRPSVVAMILANVIPLAGVFLWRWEVFPLLLLFWFENVIIGVFNALKMLLAEPRDPGAWLVKLLVVPFFCFHYGMFTFVHGVFVMGLFGGAFRPGAGFPTPAVFWQTALGLKLPWAMLGLAISHGVSFATNYLGRGEYRRADPQRLMALPYGRVMVLHFTILLGGFLMLALHSPVAGLALLVVLKTALDVHAHLRERRKFAANEGANS